MKLLKMIAILGFAVAASAAHAEVTINPDGTGFVGKGDVQLAFGWNNAKLQDNASKVRFIYKATDTYIAVCTWLTGEGTRGEKTHNVNHSTEAEVDTTVNSVARTNTQNVVTGFNLTGFGTSTTETGEIPVVGGPCPGNQGHDGTWSAVTPVGGTGGLYVTYEGNPGAPVLLQ